MTSGATDTEWDLDQAHPAASRTDIDYILDHVDAALTSPLTHDDIEGGYAGLRPLLSGESEATSSLSREHAVARPQPGLISIAGGKYATYRVMALDAVGAARQDLGPGVDESVTEDIPLVGAPPHPHLHRDTRPWCRLCRRSGPADGADVGMERRSCARGGKGLLSTCGGRTRLTRCARRQRGRFAAAGCPRHPPVRRTRGERGPVPGSIQSIERAAAIMTLLAAADGTLTLGEIAAAVALPKTTTHGIVSTLRAVGWIDQAGSSAGYRVAGRLAGLAQSFDAADLRSAATPWMDRLASETGLEVHLVRPEHGQAVVVQHVYRPDNSPQRLRVGEALPLHATASGKVIWSHTWPARHPSRQPLEQFTRFTLTEDADVDAELAQVRADGHAAESGEFYPDAHSLAAPVNDALGRTVAALAVLGRREDFGTGAREPLTSLVRAAGFVSRAVATLP